MPVFVEQANDERDSRVNPAHLTSLPRVSAPPPAPHDGDVERYEVVVVGSGPAGIMTSVLLARYGTTSVLTVDSKSDQVHAGQADGLQPRTLEVLQSLDLAHEVLTQGCQMHEVGFWNPRADGAGIERTAFVPDVSVPARYPHEVTIHQGRIERIMNEDLRRNGGGVQRGWTVTGWAFVAGDAEWPVEVSMRRTDAESETKSVRCKFLVGADGAHSTVRAGMGLELVGDHTDHVWGVMDSVVSTTFPDIRKRCAIHSPEGSIMIIPRERVSGKQVLTRIYCQMEDDVEQDPTIAPTTSDPTPLESQKAKAKQRRSKITLERITEQTKKVLAPYDISFASVDWWAAYQIGQRATPAFSTRDASGVARVHIAGDACHTHSPKAGQGMNVSMMDAFNLSWKLSHVLAGLAPPSLLDTYEHERLDIARQLIAFDTKFSSMFSGKIGDAHGLSHDAFVAVFRTGGGFTSGCGVEYVPGALVDADTRGVVPAAAVREDGVLWPGRRLMNVRTKRFADANPRALHDDFASTGVYRVLLLLPASFRADPAAFAPLLQACAATVPLRFPDGVVETAVVFPGERGALEWTDFPAVVKERGEWMVFGDHYGEVYKTFEVDEAKGAVAVVRPDGYVGMVAPLEGAEALVGRWLGGVLVGK
ncbi:FAD binding domain-containing protein [Geopyxis carbonaria]|nr:FAD binding domain-containing protein [Geopyxis carbonaria]